MHREPPLSGRLQRERLAALAGALDRGELDSGEVREAVAAGGAYAHLLHAAAMAGAGRAADAVAVVERAVALAPEAVVVRAAAARIRFAVRDYTTALADLAVAATSPQAAPAARAAALDSRFELLRRLGGHAEGLAAMDRALELDGGSRERSVRRLERAAELLIHSGNDRAALMRISQAIALAPRNLALLLRAAVLQCRAGDAEAVRRSVAAATELDAAPEDALRARLDGARYLIEVGAFAAGRELLHAALQRDREDPVALSWLGELALWAGDTAAVEEHARVLTAAGAAAGWRLRGAVAVLAGDCAAALPLLEESLRRDDSEATTHVWRGEALYRLGALDDAFAAINRGGEMTEEFADYLAPQVLRLLVLAARDEFPGLPEYCVPQALDRMMGEEFAATDRGDVPRLCALLERALVGLRGNRHRIATYVAAADGGGEPVALHLQPSPRGPAKAALWLLLSEGEDSARRALEGVHAEYPQAPEPHCYHGELYLYLGDYVAAREQFERALALYEMTRWAFIGLGAVELFEGRPQQTIPLLERSIALSRGAGPTLFVYRGEAHRRLGNTKAAIADLEYATRLNPTRVSAWIDLALARDDAGDGAALAGELDRLRRVAPGLLHDAASAAGIAPAIARGDEPAPAREVMRELYECALHMMRGNRSSNRVTYFTADGQLRVVAPVPTIDTAVEQRELKLARTLVLRAAGVEAARR